MRFAAPLFVLLCCCSPTGSLRPEVLFEEARKDLWAGELAKAQTESERGLSLASERHDPTLQWKFRLLRSEILLNSRRAEEVLNQLEDARLPQPPSPQLIARKKMLEGQAYSILGDSTKYEALLNEAHQLATAAHADDVLIDIETLQGSTLIFRARYDEAEHVLRNALERARQAGSQYSLAGVLVNLGRIRLRRHRYDEAASIFEDASRVCGPQYALLYTVVQDNLATCYRELGEHDRALRIQLDSIARHEQSGARFYLPGAVGSAGESYLYKGEPRKAVPYLQRALSLALEIHRTADAAAWAGSLASVYVELEDWRDAEALNQEAIRLKGSINSPTVYENALIAGKIETGKGDSLRATGLYLQALTDGKENPDVTSQAHEGLGVVALKRNDREAAVKEFEGAVTELENARFQVERTEFKLGYLTRRIRLYRQYVDALLSEGQVERALAVADSSRAQVLAQRSESAPVRRLPPGAFLNFARQSGSVLVSYWLAPNQSHAWVVTPREIHHVTLPPLGEIEPLVAQYQEAVERQLADPLRAKLAVGEKLYQTLIAPVSPFLPKGAHVVVVPDGVLHGLNLESLPVPGDNPHYWIQDVTLEIAPSLAMGGKPQDKPANRRLLLLGDPLSGDPTFPPLAHAAREIASVKQNFTPSDQVVLTRDSATPQAYLAAATGPFAAIHFTAHALANRENPLESAVLLSGGKLYARDVMDLALNTDLVTVSACRGAGQRTYSGEGLVGFAWAFLRAGARHVIAGLWDVNDQSTADLMDVLYRELAAGRRPADALRAAKLAMIESRGNLRKPYYWAPFQLYTVAP